MLVTHGSLQKFQFSLLSARLCELVRHKLGADLLLTQIFADDGVRRVLANVQFLRNQS